MYSIPNVTTAPDPDIDMTIDMDALEHGWRISMQGKLLDTLNALIRKRSFGVDVRVLPDRPGLFMVIPPRLPQEDMIEWAMRCVIITGLTT